MKQYSIYKHIAAAVVVAASCLALSSMPVSAESNAPGMRLALTSDWAAANKWTYYIYIKPGEKAVARFKVSSFGELLPTEVTKGTFTLTDPEGNVISDQSKTVSGATHGLPGNTEGKPSEVLLESPVATKAGVYKLHIESASGAVKPDGNARGFFYMDWTIGATKTDADSIVPNLGRVWMEEEYFVKDQYPESITDLTLFYVSKDGYHYKTDYRGYMGYNSTFSTNRYGIVKKGSCGSAYRSFAWGWGDDKINDLSRSENCGGQNKIFFANPDPTLPQSVKLPDGKTTWLNNPIKPTSIDSMQFTSANDKNIPLKGEVTANIKNYTGNTTLLVDTNGNGSFTDPEDRKILFNTKSEQVKYLFDGKDNQGNIIPKNVRVAFRIDADKKGEIHFTRDDADDSKGGISVKRLNGSSAKTTWLYWNDSHFSDKKCGTKNIEPLNNQAGVDSSDGVHSWDADGCLLPNGKPSYGNSYGHHTEEQQAAASSWGDGRVIDDWAYDEGSAYSSVVFYGEVTPDPTPEAPNTGAAQLTANGTKALPWLLGAGAIAYYYLRRRA